MPKIDLSALKHIPVGWAILGIVAGVVTGAWGTYKFVARDLPEIRDGVRAIRDDMRKSEERERAILDAHIGQEETARAKLDSSLKVLQANMVAVIQKVEHRQLKPAEIREIMASVRDVSSTEASNLNPPVIFGEWPKMPTAVPAATADVRQEIKDTFNFSAQAQSATQPDKFVKAALFAKDAQWEATSRGIKVTYDGGSAVFTPKYNVSPDALKKQADIFNAMTLTIKGTIVTPPEVKLNFEKFRLQLKPRPETLHIDVPSNVPDPNKPPELIKPEAK